MVQRQSNIELLRLLSMLMIVIYHFNGHALATDAAFFSSEGIMWNLTHTLTISATSIFVLISGYFGINFRIKGVLKLYLRCAVWGVVGYVFCSVFANAPSIELTKLFARLMPFTHGKWWFIVTYLELYFLSPILNAAIEMFDKCKHMVAILIFGFVTLYMGYCRETGEDTWGTSLSHFLWLYIIARYIYKYISFDSIRAKRWWWLAGFIMSSALTYGLAAIESQYAVPCCMRAYPYCSPWVLMGALCLLLVALSFHFESKTINWLASSSLSAYLIQDHLYFGSGLLYPMVGAWMMSMTLSVRYALLIPLSICFLLIVCVLDKVLEFCIYKQIICLYDKLKLTEPWSGK